MADKQDKKKRWEELAQAELKGKSPAALSAHTAEGIDIAPLYTSADLDGLDHLDSVPGEAPFTRGPRATMYTVRPGLSANMPDFPPQKKPINFSTKPLMPGKKDCRLLLIWPPTGAMIQTMHGCAAMLARPG